MAVFSIWIVSILTFVIIQMPAGDWLDIYLEEVRSAGYNLPIETE